MRLYGSFHILILSLLTAFFSAGCSNIIPEIHSPSKSPPQNEPPYFGTPIAIPEDAITLAGSATFKARVPHPDNGLGPIENKNYAIPYAEFHIYENGVRIQQGETTASGEFEFEIPKKDGDYQIRVFSRSLSHYLKVSVLDQLNTSNPYFISENFTLTDGTPNKELKLIAEADENLDPLIRGGAFAIYSDILFANKYIRKEIGKNGDDGVVPSNPNASNWWVAPKVKVYWKAGFNPYSYFGDPSVGSSFYLPSTTPNDRSVFILGGLFGDVKGSDTDHFDSSIIIHEYMHFLEDAFSNSSSMGGMHDGNSIIDPRLAWSEGLANYFQSAVLSWDNGKINTSGSYYLDTIGHSNGKRPFSFDLAAHGKDGSQPDSVKEDSRDYSGVFRELSIARTLYKVTRASSVNLPQCASGCDSAPRGGDIPFVEVWKNLTGSPESPGPRSSLKNTLANPIANVGIFNKLLSSHFTLPVDAEEIFVSENQPLTDLFYMPRLYPVGSDCSYQFAGASFEYGEVSNQMMNNHFYIIKKSDLANYNLHMNQEMPLSSNLNLDLIIYKKEYRYVEDKDWSTRNNTVLTFSRSTNATESVNLSSLPDDFLVINIKVAARGRTQSQLSHTTNYSLKLGNGVHLCPSTP